MEPACIPVIACMGGLEIALNLVLLALLVVPAVCIASVLHALSPPGGARIAEEIAAKRGKPEGDTT